MNGTPYITATLIKDAYQDDRVAMHHHLIGHNVESIYDLRSGYGTTWHQWPMVDLWARVPTELLEKYGKCPEALDYAKNLRNESHLFYDGKTGW